MTLPRGLIDQAKAAEIKVDLWAGHLTQEAIALKHNVSQPSISRIFRGRDWRNLPWPDGSLGHIPTERRALIHASRHRNTRFQHDSRTRYSELETKTSDDINKIVEGLLAVSSSELRNIISGKTSKRGKRTKRSVKMGTGIGTQDMLGWPDIKEQDPGHPIVIQLSEEDDKPLKVALRIVCAKVPQVDWQRPEVLQMVEDEAIKIREKLK